MGRWPDVTIADARAAAADARTAGAERAVLHPRTAPVFEEHDPVADGKVTAAALDVERDVLAQLIGYAQPRSGRFIDHPHLVTPMADRQANAGITSRAKTPAYSMKRVVGSPGGFIIITCSSGIRACLALK